VVEISDFFRDVRRYRVQQVVARSARICLRRALAAAGKYGQLSGCLPHMPRGLLLCSIESGATCVGIRRACTTCSLTVIVPPALSSAKWWYKKRKDGARRQKAPCASNEVSKRRRSIAPLRKSATCSWKQGRAWVDQTTSPEAGYLHSDAPESHTSELSRSIAPNTIIAPPPPTSYDAYLSRLVL